MMVTDFIIRIEKDGNLRWFVFFTSWNYMACVVYFITITIQNGLYVFKKDNVETQQSRSISMDSVKKSYSSTDNIIDEFSPKNDVQLTGADKFVWFMFNVTLPVCTSVVAAFWGVIYGPSISLSYFTIDRHAIILFLILLDFSFQSIPVRVLHFIYPMTFLVLYMIFSVIYSYATDDVIYDPPNWRKDPKKAAILFSVIILASGVIHFAFYGIDRLKKLIGQRCCNSNQVPTAKENV